MDLAHPLRSVVPSLDGVALEILASTESALRISEIRAQADAGSHTGLLKVLCRLVEHGLVICEGDKHVLTYRLNREHVLAAGLLTLTGAQRELVNRVGEAVLDLAPPPRAACLLAASKEMPPAQCDQMELLLVRPTADTIGLERWAAQIDDLRSAVVAWSGNPVLVTMLAEKNLFEAVRTCTPLRERVLKTGTVLLGAELVHRAMTRVHPTPAGPSAPT
jgi:hypothetical protein